MKKTILCLLLSIFLLLPVSAGPSGLEAGIYHASDIDYLYLLDAADGTQLAQFITTDGLGNETFSLTALWNGMEGSVVKNGKTIRFTAEIQDDNAIYINQDVYLIEELSGFYVPSDKAMDITETTAVLLIEHHPAMNALLGDDPQWTIAPALADNLFYSLSAEGSGPSPLEFYVLRSGRAIFRMDTPEPQLIYGSLQSVLDALMPQTVPELPYGLDLYAHPLGVFLPGFLAEAGISYSSSDPNIIRVNSRGMLLPRSAGTAEIRLAVTMGSEKAELILPVTVTNTPTKGQSNES